MATKKEQKNYQATYKITGYLLVDVEGPAIEDAIVFAKAVKEQDVVKGDWLDYEVHLTGVNQIES